MGAQLAAGGHGGPGRRGKIAFLLFLLALVSPLLGAVVLASDLPMALRRSAGGLLLFGVPMALMLAVVALTGQAAFSAIKRMAGQNPRPTVVSRGRYRIGLVLVLAGVLVSWLEPLVSEHAPGLAARRVLIGALSDGSVLLGLCVLGGAFWDKFEALFIHDARVVADPGEPRAEAQAVLVTWRFYVGSALLACIPLAWALIPLASSAGWSTAQVASLTAGIFIANKVLFIAAIAIMGKSGFSYLKALLMHTASKFAPAQQVSAGRYRLGLLLFLVPMLMTWLQPYAAGLARTIGVWGFLHGLALELLLLVGLFLLGGEFWGKVRALFRHGARVEIPRRFQG